jgi:hypothetical protein
VIEGGDMAALTHQADAGACTIGTGEVVQFAPLP